MAKRLLGKDLKAGDVIQFPKYKAHVVKPAGENHDGTATYRPDYSGRQPRQLPLHPDRFYQVVDSGVAGNSGQATKAGETIANNPDSGATTTQVDLDGDGKPDVEVTTTPIENKSTSTLAAKLGKK